LCIYDDEYDFVVDTEQVADRGSSKVDYVLQVDDRDEVLVEAKSPSVMNNVGRLLPQHGIELTWAPRQTLAPKMLTGVSMLFSSPTTLAFKKYI
jgi:hypothetical protein